MIILRSTGPVISTRRSRRSAGNRRDLPVAVANGLGLGQEVRQLRRRRTASAARRRASSSRRRRVEAAVQVGEESERLGRKDFRLPGARLGMDIECLRRPTAQSWGSSGWAAIRGAFPRLFRRPWGGRIPDGGCKSAPSHPLRTFVKRGYLRETLGVRFCARPSGSSCESSERNRRSTAARGSAPRRSRGRVFVSGSAPTSCHVLTREADVAQLVVGHARELAHGAPGGADPRRPIQRPPQAPRRCETACRVMRDSIFSSVYRRIHRSATQAPAERPRFQVSNAKKVRVDD